MGEVCNTVICRLIMAAISGKDLTLHHTEPMELIATARQRVLCARNVINFAANVPKRDHLPVLLSALSSSVQRLRFEAAASLHVLSRLHVGVLSLVGVCRCPLLLPTSLKIRHSWVQACLTIHLDSLTMSGCRSAGLFMWTC